MRIRTATFGRLGLGNLRAGSPKPPWAYKSRQRFRGPKRSSKPTTTLSRTRSGEGSRVYNTSRQRVARTESQGRKETRWRRGRVQNIPGNAIKASPHLEQRCIRAPLNPFEAAEQLPEGPAECCQGERSTTNALYAHRAQADRGSSIRPGAALTSDTPPRLVL